MERITRHPQIWAMALTGLGMFTKGNGRFQIFIHEGKWEISDIHSRRETGDFRYSFTKGNGRFQMLLHLSVDSSSPHDCVSRFFAVSSRAGHDGNMALYLLGRRVCLTLNPTPGGMAPVSRPGKEPARAVSTLCTLTPTFATWTIQGRASLGRYTCWQHPRPSEEPLASFQGLSPESQRQNPASTGLYVSI